MEYEEFFCRNERGVPICGNHPVGMWSCGVADGERERYIGQFSS